MSAEKCPDCGAWWAWPSEHRCPPITSTNTANLDIRYSGPWPLYFKTQQAPDASAGETTPVLSPSRPPKREGER